MANQSFFSAQGGDDTAKRKLAAALLLQGVDTSPVQSWTQGAARIAQALMGGYMLHNLDQEDQAATKNLMNLPGLGGMPSAAPTASPTSAPAAPDTVAPIIQNVAQKYNIDPNYALKTAQIESNFNPAAASTSSNARGLYQFIPSTWAKYGNGADVNDPAANADAFGRLTADNMQAFQQKFGRAPTPGELYLMHQQGPAGAAALLSSPQANVVDALAPAYGGNRQRATSAIANNGGSPAMTAGDFANIWQGKFGQPVAQNGTPQGLPVGRGGPSPIVGALAQPQRSTMGIPPEIAPQIQQLLANPKTRQYGIALYSQFAKPSETYRPITNQERSTYGVGPGVPAQIDTATNKLNVMSPQVAIDQRSESEFEKTYGGGMAKEALGVIESGNKASDDLQKVQLLKGLLGQIQTGQLTPAQSTIGAWMQSVGLDPKQVGIDPNLPATAEAATALLNKFALGNIGATTGGIPANNFSEADRNFIVQMVPNLRNRPEANTILLEAKQREAQLAMLRADQWAQARSQGISYEKFNQAWQRKMATTNVFGDLAQKAQGIGSAPPSSGNVGGAVDWKTYFGK